MPIKLKPHYLPLRPLAILAILAVVAASCTEVPEVQTTKAIRKSLLVPILAGGALEPPPGGEIRATEGGVTGQIFVHEGQHVVRDTPLVQLVSPELNQRVFASQTESQQLAEEQQKTANALSLLRSERDRFKAIAEADIRLLHAGAITAQQSSTDQTNYEQALRHVTEMELQAAGVATRKRIVDDAARALEQRSTVLTVRAPIDGIIYNLPRVAGENIMPGQLLGNVADPHHLRVRIRVDSPDLPRIHSGQRLMVTFDGLPGKRWDGTVILVPPGLRDVGGREVGEVIGELSDDTGTLPANASVNVEIIVGEKAEALTIPRGALIREADTRYIFRYLDGHARKANVSVGLIGPNDVEITGGLREGDEVILPGSATLRDGQTVKAGTPP